MQVGIIQNFYYQNRKATSLKNTPPPPSFKASAPLQAVSAKASGGVEYLMRVIANILSNLFQPESSKVLTKSIANLVPKQNKDFLESLNQIARIYSTQKIINTNLDEEILEQIVNEGGSTIFMMNHSNQTEDPQMLAVLNAFLTDAYIKNGNEEFPLPKIILNEDILKTMNPTKRKAFENFGAVGIDASLENGDKGVNTRAFLPLVKDFVRDKCNIFIFPEGRLAIRKDLEFFQRFQPGVANLVDKILKLKKQVRVVPVGFAYGSGEQKDLTAMNIGTPIIIKRNEVGTTITKGDAGKTVESPLYSFLNKHKEEDVMITCNGQPVAQKEVADYLRSILCENLEINSNIAQKELKTLFEQSEVESF